MAGRTIANILFFATDLEIDYTVITANPTIEYTFPGTVLSALHSSFSYHAFVKHILLLPTFFVHEHLAQGHMCGMWQGQLGEPHFMDHIYAFNHNYTCQQSVFRWLWEWICVEFSRLTQVSRLKLFSSLKKVVSISG